MPLESLLAAVPNVDVFWSKNGAMLEDMGYSKDAIKTVEDLTDMVLMNKVLRGDLAAKKYLDERVDAERRARRWDTQNRKHKP